MKTLLRPLCGALAAALLFSGCATRPAAPLELNLVALNDFHGHLEASRFNYLSARDNKEASMLAGGIDSLAAALQAYRAQDQELMLVGAGDLVGASPAMSSMWADEPSINALGMLGMRVSSVGNHEFDSGRAELLRQQNGGCNSPRADKACKIAPNFSGAGFSYLAANVIDSSTGAPLLPAFSIQEAKGVKVAFIGAVLKEVPSVALASGIAGLEFTDEADAVNRALGQARAQGATVFVALIHQGGETDEPFDQPDCSKLKGPIVAIARRLDPAIRLIISGHSHSGFQCKVDGRTITQAEMAGHVLSRIRLEIDPASRALREVTVRNVPVKPGEYPPDPKVSAYLAEVQARSRAALARPIARVAVRSTLRKLNDAGESALGGLIADAALAATAAEGAQIAFMNTGGMRKDFEVGENLTATYGQAQVVLPFGNTLVAMDLTGAQLRALLEQQWLRPDAAAGHSMLQVSAGFSYRWDKQLPKGQRVLPGSLTLNGVALADDKTYRVAANNFLAEGGDGFVQFKDARNKVDTQIRDLDAFVAYLVGRERDGRPAGFAAPQARIERVR